jgi:hypothetical protein
MASMTNITDSLNPITRGAKVIVKCNCCKQLFSARVADRQRGWARFCSKSCKAKKQEARTGQYSDLLHLRSNKYYGDEEPEFNNAHQFSNEEHDCNKD